MLGFPFATLGRIHPSHRTDTPSLPSSEIRNEIIIRKHLEHLKTCGLQTLLDVVVPLGLIFAKETPPGYDVDTVPKSKKMFWCSQSFENHATFHFRGIRERIAAFDHV